MRLNRENDVREVLRNSKGLAVYEISERLGMLPDTVVKILRRCPDMYIHSWALAQRPGSKITCWYAIWRLAKIPADCPRPNNTRDRTPKGASHAE